MVPKNIGMGPAFERSGDNEIVRRSDVNEDQ